MQVFLCVDAFGLDLPKFFSIPLLHGKRSSFPTLFGGGPEPEDVSRVEENGSHLWLII